MTIQFECECGETLEVGEEFAGKRGRCPTCKAIVRVPEMVPGPPQLKGYQAEAPDDPGTAEEAGDGSPERLGDEPEGLEEANSNASAFCEGRALWERWRKPLFFLLAPIVVGGVSLYFALRGVPKGPEERGPVKETPRLVAKEVVPEVSPQGTAPSVLMAQPPSSVSGTKEIQETHAEPAPQGTSEPVAASKDGPKEVAPLGGRKSREEVPKTTSSPISGTGRYTVRVGSFREQDRAERLVADLRKRGFEAFVWTVEVPEKGKWHRVGVGRFENRKEAERFAKGLKERMRLDGVVTASPTERP